MAPPSKYLLTSEKEQSNEKAGRVFQRHKWQSGTQFLAIRNPIPPLMGVNNFVLFTTLITEQALLPDRDVTQAGIRTQLSNVAGLNLSHLARSLSQRSCHIYIFSSI